MVLTLTACWAKTGEDGGYLKSVVEHCEDVGLVATSVVANLAPLLKQLLPSGAISLIAAHDIGKVSPGFLLKSPTWRAEWQTSLCLDGEGYEARHQWVSQKFVSARYSKAPRWLISLGGHHGRYLCSEAKPHENPFSPSRIGGRIFEELRCELLHGLEQSFGPLPPEHDIEKGARLHWFTGLMVFCDWLGSNTDWFPPAEENHISERGAKASAVVERLGIGRNSVQQGLSFEDIFRLPAPRPLQAVLQEAMDRPGLYIVEAPMGEGKTEAALAGAYRRWSEGDERGLYFALPTQLTSNRIRERVEDFCRRVIEEDSAIALVHGGARLEQKPVRILRRGSTEEESDELGDSLESKRWFADGRRSLLVPFGVGTVDQALMAVVPVRYSALRMFGLGGKVVVIDEVHSYDSFTSALVDRLVSWLIELGGTVIVLSATLTAARRASLVEAAGACERTLTQSYPLVTKVASGSRTAEHIEVAPNTDQQRTVNVVMQPAEDSEWMRDAVNAAKAGACVMVIRNTVDLARSTYSALRGLCGAGDVRFGLIHSRFTQADRTVNEAEWTDLLGRNGDRRPAKGAILVGTQVLEQSLDIDADMLVTDLAPTDLILQRVGRLHRHKRRRPSICAEARCLILRPNVDWRAPKPEVLDALKPHRFIYPAFSLYMADSVWSEVRSLNLPSDIRGILEASSSLPEGAPKAVCDFWNEAQAEAQKMKDTAWVNDVFKVPAAEDSEAARTRWGMQRSAWIVIVEEEPRKVGPNTELVFPGRQKAVFDESSFDFNLAKLLRLHAVRVPAYLLRGMSRSQPRWLREHLQDAFLGIIDKRGSLSLWQEEACPHSFTYDSENGLGVLRNISSERTGSEDEASWH